MHQVSQYFMSGTLINELNSLVNMIHWLNHCRSIAGAQITSDIRDVNGSFGNEWYS